MPSSHPKPSDRRKTFLRLAGEIEGQLRDAYDHRYRSGVTQASIADKLGVNRSAIHHRLMGRGNMTIETIADMVWALGCKISIKISDAATATNHPLGTADQPNKFDDKVETTQGVVDFDPDRRPDARAA